MTPKQRFIAALERKPLIGRVPTFELVFFLTMEKFGKVHPSHRDYRQMVIYLLLQITSMQVCRWKDMI